MNNGRYLTFILILIATGCPSVTGEAPAARSALGCKKEMPDQKPHSAGTEARSQGERISVTLDRGGKVGISIRSGRITLTGWDRNLVEAEATSERGRESLELKDTTGPPRVLVISSSYESRRSGSEVNLIVKVPRYAEIESIELRQGDIEVSGIEGSIKIGTGHGDVRVNRVGSVEVSHRNGDVIVSAVNGSAALQVGSGDVVANDIKGDLIAKVTSGDVRGENVSGLVNIASSSGDVSIRNAGGDVTGVSASGDIAVHCAKGRADLGTASGSITVTGVGGDVEVATASGDVTFTGAIRPDGRYRLKTVSGEVIMAIQPDPPGFTATLQSYSGGIETDFPLKVEKPLEPLNRRLIGRWRDGKAQITLDSFSGVAKLTKADPAAIKDCK